MEYYHRAVDYGKVILSVTGCMHDTVGDVVNGSYQLEDLIDGKPMFKKDEKVNGLDVLIYYAGRWCFGPQVGGVVVWATNDGPSPKLSPA